MSDDTTFFESYEVEPLDMEEVIAEFEAIDPGPGVHEDHVAKLHRYIRMRLSIEAEIERVRRQTKAIIARLEKKLDAIQSAYEPSCREITRRMLKRDKKSVSTPWGTAGFRAVPPAVEIVDPGVFLMDAPEELVRVKREPNKVAVNERFKATGEIPPGCEVRPAGETFYVR